MKIIRTMLHNLLAGPLVAADPQPELSRLDLLDRRS